MCALTVERMMLALVCLKGDLSVLCMKIDFPTPKTEND